MIEEFADLPPRAYEEQVLINCSHAALTYRHLWKKQDHDGVFAIDKKDMANEFLEEPPTVMRRLRAICRLGLINIDETKHDIKVELVQWDQDSEMN
jgi:hypothetical protein